MIATLDPTLFDLAATAKFTSPDAHVRALLGELEEAHEHGVQVSSYIRTAVDLLFLKTRSKEEVRAILGDLVFSVVSDVGPDKMILPLLEGNPPGTVVLGDRGKVVGYA